MIRLDLHPSLVRAALLLSLAWPAHKALEAQESRDTGVERTDYFRVYGYETPLQGWLEPTFWTTHMPRSNADFGHFGLDVGRGGLTAYSGEIEYGLLDHMSLSTYFNVQDPHGSGPRFTEGRIEARYRFRDSYDLPVNLAVYAEYYLPRKSFSQSQELELKLIAEKDLEDFRVDLNPTVEVYTTGPEAGSAPRLSFDAGAYYRRYFRIQPGLEYYGVYGKINSPAAARDQQQQIFPTVDVRLGRNLDWQVGVGFGLTHETDPVTLKSILTYEFPLIRPQRLFGKRG